MAEYKPKVYAIMVCHTKPLIIGNGITNLFETVGTSPEKLILVDNCYPLRPQEQREYFSTLGENKFIVTKPIKNLGGHGGFNFAFNQLLNSGLNDNDIIIGIDPDCNIPIESKGWGDAITSVMMEDSSIGSLSLLHDAFAPHNESQWNRFNIKGHIVGFLNKPEMFNVTAWKVRFLRLTEGLQALYKFYGHVEVAMHHKAMEFGFKQGYMLDFRETFNLIPHDEEYNKWKAAHLGGYEKNFNEWLIENNI